MRSPAIVLALLVFPAFAFAYDIVQTYPGPARPPAEVARLRFEVGPVLEQFDGRELARHINYLGVMELELLPGRHVVVLEYAFNRLFSTQPKAVEFHAEAGKAYLLKVNLREEKTWNPTVEPIPPPPAFNVRVPICFLVDEGTFTVAQRQSYSAYRPLLVKGADGVERSFTVRRGAYPDYYVDDRPVTPIQWHVLQPGDSVHVYSSSCDDHEHAVRLAKITK
jgi:hypothetical protein